MTIVNFMNQRFERIIDTQQAIRLLRKFETLNLPNMGIQDKYLRILNHYAKDIDYVSRTYQKNKTDPPVARDLPPIAGKVLKWNFYFRGITIAGKLNLGFGAPET